MTDSKKYERKPAKPKAVLGDHKRVGKRFIPPIAQLGISDVRWIESCDRGSQTASPEQDGNRDSDADEE